MNTTIQLLAIFAALLLIPVSCQDLLRPDKPDGPPDNACGIAEARERAGESGVWVRGHIVGVATGTRKFVFEGPFTKNTNLILGPEDSTSTRDLCLAVQLPSGPLRDALNLADHPDLLGREVYIKGDLVDAYYGIPGLKSPSKFWLSPAPE